VAEANTAFKQCRAVLSSQLALPSNRSEPPSNSPPPSCLVHGDVGQHLLVGLVLRVDVMLVHHVALPVVLPGERLAALPRVRAVRLGAVELARLDVLVVDVPVEVRYRAEAPPTSRVRAFIGPVVIPTVVASIVCKRLRREIGSRRWNRLNLLELVIRALHNPAHVADEPARRPSRRPSRRRPWRPARGRTRRSAARYIR
jgi:hypothetical protein